MDGASDVSSGSGAESPPDDQAVCRDFLRNVCRRGRRCKFPHPEEASDRAAPPPTRPELLTFCHDYQNGQCVRPTCRFVHCDRTEMEMFRRTGGLPTHLLESAVKRGVDIRVGPFEVPVCKDFARGECARGAKCKYRHLSISELEQQLLNSGSCVMKSCSATGGDGGSDSSDACEPPEAKRRMCDDYSRRGVVVRDYRQAPPKLQPNPHSIIDYRLIEDENRILQRRVHELQKQVDDLTTTNEFLLDQNAQMRMAKLAQPASAVNSLTTVTVPAGTMAGPISQPMVASGGTTQMVTVLPPTRQMVTVPAVPVSLAHTPGSTATIAVSLAPVSITQPGAVVSMASINQAAASMASIANQVTMAINQSNINQQSGSMASINQATMASISQQQNGAASIGNMGGMSHPQQQQNVAVAASMANMNQANMAPLNPMGPSMASMSQPGVVASMASMNPLPASMDQATMASMNPMAAASINPMAAASIQQPVAVASMASINTAEAAAAAQVNGQVACSISGGSIVSYPIISQLRPILSSNLTQ